MWVNYESLIIKLLTRVVELGIFYLCFLSVLSSIFVLQMWISIQYVSKLDKPFFLYEGLAPTSVRRSFSLYRQLPEFYSPGIFLFLHVLKHCTIFYFLIFIFAKNIFVIYDIFRIKFKA